MTTGTSPKRQAILDAAKRAFLAHGYSGVSMEAIAEAAPVSKPTLYKHFKGKQELFAAVIGGQCEELLNTLTQAQTETRDTAAGLKAIVRALVDLIYSNEALNLHRLIIAEQQHFPELGALVYRSGPEPVLKLLSSYLTKLDARQALRIPDVGTSSKLLVGMLKGDDHFRCLLGLQPGLSETEKERITEAAVALFLKGHGYEI
ncbi:TetR/AcrR family transcriptional regulator [Methylococcus sp. EFPC2]|uniref:TetR/AcrR family transcriptional regulator n=1 Tax=Methylococcus sp. EFPC2 TaxID=2812648 RepID=UPI001966E8AD|nr:TetR/AcrR family transcriptional regulator [Methylococcus sp. EFPC2]QSA96527.1 TetR/AcrR family transcriptional regulator [Methylococcus sp. EFPC2]